MYNWPILCCRFTRVKRELYCSPIHSLNALDRFSCSFLSTRWFFRISSLLTTTARYHLQILLTCQLTLHLKNLKYSFEIRPSLFESNREFLLLNIPHGFFCEYGNTQLPSITHKHKKPITTRPLGRFVHLSIVLIVGVI